MTQTTIKQVRRGRIFPEIQWSEEQKKQWREENEALRKRCFPIFERVKKELIKTHYNWYIAIEPESETYLIGQDKIEICHEILQKYPNLKTCLFTINETGVSGTV